MNRHDQSVDIAIFIARELLADQIRSKIKDDLEADAAEAFTEPESPLFLDGHNVIEILEELVEGGDAVINDAADHQWFRNKLAEQRDLEARIDQFGLATVS